MNISESIRHRKSVRTFTGEALHPEEKEAVLAWAGAVENPYGIPVEYRLLDGAEHGLSSPVITGTDIYLAGKLKRQSHAEEAFGYSFEQVLLRADALGLGTVMIAGTMDRPAFEKAMELGQDEVMPCVSPLGYPAKKQSLRETMMRKGIRADSRLPFGELFFGGSFDSALTPGRAGALAEPLELVRWAPSAVNRQPWRVVVDGGRVHFYEKRARGFVDASGWDTQKIDLGIALCHFALAMEENGRKASFVLEDPGIACPADTVYTATYLLD